MFVPKPAHAALCYWSLLCNDIWPRGIEGAPENSTVCRSQTIERTVTNEEWFIWGKSFKNGHEFIKMCIVCILFLLAVHRLVLIVNSSDVFGEQERGGRLSPYYWNSVLLRPDESFRICFVLFVFSLSWRSWKGSVLQRWRTRRVEDYDKEKNNISPWRKRIKKINGCFVWSCASTMFYQRLTANSAPWYL